MTSSEKQDDLRSWTQSQLSTLCLSSSEPEFDTNFDSTFAPDAELTVNGASVSREAFKDDIRGLSKASTAVTDVRFDWEQENSAVTLDESGGKPSGVRVISLGGAVLISFRHCRLGL